MKNVELMMESIPLAVFELPEVRDASPSIPATFIASASLHTQMHQKKNGGFETKEGAMQNLTSDKMVIENGSRHQRLKNYEE
ncbi:hypothetical protein M569_14386 [Genlisea aurea]|uniref:Uncharacterized protein n=1 Tax=Genlisea aurea TaxID=192259 RepID=S8DLK8_9LAMI|nr:hypothetical protein M569_14386 [Genlisea aurea]